MTDAENQVDPEIAAERRNNVATAEGRGLKFLDISLTGGIAIT